MGSHDGRAQASCFFADVRAARRRRASRAANIGRPSSAVAAAPSGGDGMTVAVDTAVRSHTSGRNAPLVLGTVALLFASVVLSASTGALAIPISTTLSSVAKGLTGGGHALDGLEGIVWNLRIP